MEPLVYTADQVCWIFSFVKRDGKTDRKLLYGLVDADKFPQPIDATLAKAYWRWSRRDVESYANGEWGREAS